MENIYNGEFTFNEYDVCSEQTLDRLKQSFNKKIILSIELKSDLLSHTLQYSYINNNNFSISHICYIDRPTKNIKIVIYKPKQTFCDMGELGTYVMIYEN